ncbi:hypothetical protein [Streptomyces sp. NPDC055140]
MSISVPAPVPGSAPVPSVPVPAAGTGTVPRFPRVPARAGNANVRALLAQGIHPASRQPLTAATGTNCGNCAFAYRIKLPDRDGNGASSLRERLKCAKAPISRRGRQGIDLRSAHTDPSATPACTLHCSHTDWPYDPDGRYDTGAGQIGTGRDHDDDWGVYAVYRIFGIDPEYQRAWVELEAEMVPDPAAPTGYITRPPRHSRPDKPHLYRFWTRLSRLHTAHITHPTDTDTGACEHPLVRNGRVLLGQLHP